MMLGKHKQSSTVLMIVQRANKRQVHVITLLVCTYTTFFFFSPLTLYGITFKYSIDSRVSNCNLLEVLRFMLYSAASQQYLWVFYYFQIYTYIIGHLDIPTSASYKINKVIYSSSLIGIYNIYRCVTK